MSSRLRDTIRHLFEFFCEVSPGYNGREPYIVRKYPESCKNEEELKNVPKFTFPCQLEKLFIQHYSFVLTSVDSKYSFCFCRYDPKLGTCLVILSHLPWHDIFYKLLNSIATILNSPQKDELSAFLEACRIRPPMPGHTLKVTYNAGHNVFTCQCPDKKLPSIPENCNLTEYFSAVDTKCMAGLWAALLNERRIAIVASKPSRLSATVQAANATLFPMSWQHIFIPILPEHLVDYLLAPMPFLIGVPRTVMESVKMSEIGDVVILDADANILKTPFNDLESLPSEVVSNLKKSLSDKNALGDVVSRAFLRALVCLIGGYHDAIRIENGQLITFDPEAFVKTRKHMQSFLRKILQSQIFQQFIDERLDLLNSGRGFNDEFEVECHIYFEKMSRGSAQRVQQYRDWLKSVKKEGGAFFKTVKDKANPAVQSAVKTVRQGGKNMKTAVKGLKSKMPKTGSRPSSINTTDDSRYSYGSATPVSSGSSDSLPSHDSYPRNSPPTLPLDLLTEMQSLFPGDSAAHRSATLSHNAQNYTPLTSADKAKTLSPSIPPRLPGRPTLPTRYPIISTRKLVDVSDAPMPPPRANASGNSNTFVSHITKNEPNGHSVFHTSPIHFTEVGKDSTKLKLSTSSDQRKLSWSTSLNPTSQMSRRNGSKASAVATLSVPCPPARKSVPVGSSTPPRAVVHPTFVSSDDGPSQEVSDSDSDLIQLDTSQDDSPKLEDFDPLKCRDKGDSGQQTKGSTDSALLHEYGLDFSQLGKWEYFGDGPSGRVAASPRSPVPKGWTTFQ